MSKPLRLVLPRIPSVEESASWRGHTRWRSGNARAMRDEMLATILEYGLRPDPSGGYPLPQAALRLTFGFPKARRDLDGLLSGSTPWLDAIVEAGIVGDDNVGRVPEIDLRWQRAAADQTIFDVIPIVGGVRMATNERNQVRHIYIITDVSVDTLVMLNKLTNDAYLAALRALPTVCESQASDDELLAGEIYETGPAGAAACGGCLTRCAALLRRSGMSVSAAFISPFTDDSGQ